MTEPASVPTLLVPWAVGKCPRCGSTLVADPLPHLCVVVVRVSSIVHNNDHRFRRRPVVSSKRRARTDFWEAD